MPDEPGLPHVQKYLQFGPIGLVPAFEAKAGHHAMPGVSFMAENPLPHGFRQCRGVSPSSSPPTAASPNVAGSLVIPPSPPRYSTACCAMELPSRLRAPATLCAAHIPGAVRAMRDEGALNLPLQERPGRLPKKGNPDHRIELITTPSRTDHMGIFECLCPWKTRGH